ncbi:hypothetical protein [Lysobacter sp. CA199]|uniref:hypothetical protein n=1 Tax=Lysobacter sp. CA199 TaxID=3455608 RepID=UPI003F8D681D
MFGQTIAEVGEDGVAVVGQESLTFDPDDRPERRPRRPVPGAIAYRRTSLREGKLAGELEPHLVGVVRRRQPDIQPEGKLAGIGLDRDGEVAAFVVDPFAPIQRRARRMASERGLDRAAVGFDG